jgi:hypothetical protein
VPYDIESAPEVIDYLSRLAEKTISPEAITRLMDEYAHELSQRGDSHLLHNRLAHESYRFRFESVIVDDNCLYEFRFIVDASTAAFGVLRVVYVEHELIGRRE